MKIELTNDEIFQDIRAYQARLSEAWRKLGSLPLDAATWAERKKLRTQRQELEADVRHVEGLIRIAREALAIDVAQDRLAGIGEG